MTKMSPLLERNEQFAAAYPPSPEEQAPEALFLRAVLGGVTAVAAVLSCGCR